MGFFSKKPKPVVQPIEQPVVQVPVSPMTKLDLVRQSKNVINNTLENFEQDRDMFESMAQAAASYQRVLDELDKKIQELNNADENADTEEIQKNLELLKERQELYFGGVIAPAEHDDTANNSSMKVIQTSGTFILPDDVQEYIKAFKFLSDQFYQKDAAETLATGADRMIDFIKKITFEMKDAFVNGKKLKANTCIDLMKYILMIGYLEPSGETDEDNEAIIQKRVEFINQNGSALLSALDEYYKSLAQLDIWDSNRAAIYKETQQLRYKYEGLDEVTRTEIENIDFKHAIEKYPPGSEIRKYYDFFVLCDTKTTELMVAEVKIEQLLLFLTNLKSQIRQLLLDFRLAFTDNGRNFNPAKQLLAMEKSRTNCREEALKMQQFVIDSHELDEKTKSLLKSLAANAQLADTVADAAKNVNRFYAFYDEQQEVRKRIEENKRKYELEKRKQKQEEKARKLREMQEEQKLYEQTEEPELLENED